jgi:hypothetical protein
MPVILITVDYRQITALLEDPSTKDWPGIPPSRQNEKPHYCLKNPFTEDIYEQLCPVGSRSPTLYGIPKVHKEGVSLRPTVSNIGAPTYQLSKYLAGLLSQLIGNSAHHVKNSFQNSDAGESPESQNTTSILHTFYS